VGALEKEDAVRQRQQFTISRSECKKFLAEHLLEDEGSFATSRDIRDAAELMCKPQGLAISEHPAHYGTVAEWVLQTYKARPAPVYLQDPATGKATARTAYHGLRLSDAALQALEEARSETA